MSLERPAQSDSRPSVDERLVAPGQRYEAHEGRLVYVAPADEPHGTRHSELLALLEAHAADPYDVACNMLTRTSELDDFAPDASVFPSARDPHTGGRQLEELAFEVVSTSDLAKAGVKARSLVHRGVRRVFAIDVKRQRLLEWSSEASLWQIQPQDSFVEDAALAVPLPVAALVGATSARDAVARALLRKNDPVFAAAMASGKAEGKAEGIVSGIVSGIVTVLSARGLTLTPAERERLTEERELDRLTRWLGRAVTVATSDELFDD